MFPDAPPLWEKHPNSNVVGVSDDEPGESYWKIANGIRLTGMPSYKEILTETQIWQVSLLLAHADKPLPPAAVQILRGEPSPPASVAAGPKTRTRQP
jgi:mono/diheme cytochrome c family protein